MTKLCLYYSLSQCRGIVGYETYIEYKIYQYFMSNGKNKSVDKLVIE
jgi:hypothetical protein